MGRAAIDIAERASVPEATDAPSSILSARENEVARLASAGLSNKEIARVLEISPHTVSSHMRQAFSKLGVRRRAALARLIGREARHTLSVPNILA